MQIELWLTRGGQPVCSAAFRRICCALILVAHASRRETAKGRRDWTGFAERTIRRLSHDFILLVEVPALAAGRNRNRRGAGIIPGIGGKHGGRAWPAVLRDRVAFELLDPGRRAAPRRPGRVLSGRRLRRDQGPGVRAAKGEGLLGAGSEHRPASGVERAVPPNNGPI